MTVSARKQVWIDCEIIGRQINVNKTQVHDYLYSEIKEKGWLPEILNGNQEYITKISELPGWNRYQHFLNTPMDRPRVYKPKDRNDSVETPEDQIRVAMWFIKKIGSVDQAIEAVKIAGQAIDKLGRKQR